MSVFSNLPHELIREIVKEADGGLNTHKKKFQATLDNLNQGADCITHYEIFPLTGERQPQFLFEWGMKNTTGLYGYDYDEDDDEEWMERQTMLFGGEYEDHYRRIWGEDESDEEEEEETLTRCGVGDTNVWSPKGCNCVLDEEEAELIDDYRGYCYYCKDCYESDTD